MGIRIMILNVDSINQEVTIKANMVQPTYAIGLYRYDVGWELLGGG